MNLAGIQQRPHSWIKILNDGVVYSGISLKIYFLLFALLILTVSTPVYFAHLAKSNRGINTSTHQSSVQEDQKETTTTGEVVGLSVVSSASPSVYSTNQIQKVVQNSPIPSPTVMSSNPTSVSSTTSSNPNNSTQTVSVSQSPLAVSVLTPTLLPSPQTGENVESQIPLNTSPTPIPTVTPSPINLLFDATLTYDKNSGKAVIMANKPIKTAEGVQKNPSPSSSQDGLTLVNSYTALKGMPRYACPDNSCAYIIELFFAPPNTYAYDWPYAIKVISETDEVKTFGNW